MCVSLCITQPLVFPCFINSCTLETADHKATIYTLPMVKLQEGKMVKLANMMPQNMTSVTMKLEMLVTEIVED